METTSDNDIDWEEVIVRLEAFTKSLTRKQYWFRGGSTTTFLKGKEMRDYVYEGIGKYLANPEKYDQSKGDLVSYLKFNLIRSLVSNDVTSEENGTTKDVFAYANEGEDDENTSYLDQILPYIEPMFADEIDYKKIKEYVENTIQGDTVVEEIFLGLYSEGMKRREIIKEFNMNEKDYDNGNRRLQTVIHQAAIIFKVNSVQV